MKFTIETLTSKTTLAFDDLEGYIICLRGEIAGIKGFTLLGFLQELWIPASNLSLAQAKCLLKVMRDRKKRYPLVISKKRKRK